MNSACYGGGVSPQSLACFMELAISWDNVEEASLAQLSDGKNRLKHAARPFKKTTSET